MRHRFTRGAATCAIMLVVGACTDITRPPPAQRDLRPSFSHGGPSETVCVGVITGTHDNVTVPPGQGCTVSAALVLGNVKALEDSRVGIVGSTIRGNVEGDGPEFIQVFGGTTVDGNIVVTGAGIDPPQSGPTTVALLNVTVTNGDVHVLKTIANAIFMQGVTVSKGSMKLEDNTGGGVQLFNNFVAQNLQVFKNAGDHIVTGNVVGQNLQCFDNVGTFVGGPNVAEQAQGQCF
jgi:hypothetical protein